MHDGRGCRTCLPELNLEATVIRHGDRWDAEFFEMTNSNAGNREAAVYGMAFDKRNDAIEFVSNILSFWRLIGGIYSLKRPDESKEITNITCENKQKCINKLVVDNI